MTSTYLIKKPILSRCLTVFLAFLLFVLPMSGCTNSQTKSEEAQSDVVTIRTPSAEKIEVPFDKVSSIALLDDRLVVAGTSGGAPHVALTDLNGNILLEVKDIGTAIGQAYIYGLTSEKDGFALLLGDKSTAMQPDNIAYTLVRYTAGGEFSETIKLQNAPAFLAHGIIAMPKGEYICWDMDRIYIFDQGGNLRTENAASGCELITLLNAGEKIFAAVCQDNGSGVCALDPETGDLGETFICDGLDTQFTICSGSEETLAVNSFSALYAFDIAESAFTKQFNWTGTSLKGTDISYLVLISDDKYMCVSSGELLAVTAEQETAEREKIVVGYVSSFNTDYGNNTLNAFAETFNKYNPRYYAEIKKYNYSEIQRLKTELVAGTAPDVLEVSSVSMDMDLSSDYYVDLLPYIDSDSDLSRDDFVKSVFDSIIIDGRLTSIPASFWIYTVAGRSAEVGTMSGWTMSELNSALEAKGSDCVAFPGWLTAKEMMLWVSTLSMGQFVDWTTMTCDFTNHGFIELLNFCKSMPERFDTNEYTTDYNKNILLTIQVIQNFQIMETVKKNYNGDDITFIGFPNSNGNNGSFFSAPYADIQLAIPEQTKNKDGAWAFIREMLSAEYQREVDFLPVLKTELMLRLDESINKQDAILTQEDADKFLELLNETEVLLYGDSSIQNIILEEAIAFFENAKTAEEVAELIQSRVSIYLAEKAD